MVAYAMGRRDFLWSGAAILAPCATFRARDPWRELRSADATQTAKLIATKQVTAVEVMEAAIARVNALNHRYNFLVTADFARATALARTPPTGPLASVPTLIKDLNDVAGLISRRGSRATRHSHPATKTDEPVAAFLASGLISLGTSATPEYGLLPDTAPLAFGPTRNPWNPLHSVGGSSGGAAAAVACGAVPIAHASDGGGSIRIPASCCGVMGLKPSRGRFNRGNYGQDLGVDFCVSRTARDSVTLFRALEAQLGRGSAFALLTPELPPGSTARRIGVLLHDVEGRPCSREVSKAVTDTAARLAKMGHIVEMTSWGLSRPDFTQQFLVLWASLANAVVQGWATELGKPVADSELEPFTVELAATLGSSPRRVKSAQTIVSRLAREYLKLFTRYDILLSPVVATSPPPIGWFSPTQPLQSILAKLRSYVGYTPIINVAGNCAASLPLCLSRDGLPIGVQFASAPGNEQYILEMAQLTESAGMWTGPCFR